MEENMLNTENALTSLNQTRTTLEKEQAENEKEIQDLSASIQEKSQKLEEKNKESQVYKAINTALADVLEKDLNADLSKVSNQAIYDQLNQLACHVHALKQSKEYLLAFTNDYQEKYAQYLEAKELLVNAESKYNEAMKGLNTYLMNTKTNTEEKKESSDKAKEDSTTVSSVQTGLESDVFASLATAGLALAGLFWAGAKYREEEKE